MRLEQEESTSQIVCPFKNVFLKISKDFIHVYVNSQNGILYLPHFKVHEMLWGGEHFNQDQCQPWHSLLISILFLWKDSINKEKGEMNIGQAPSAECHTLYQLCNHIPKDKQILLKRYLNREVQVALVKLQIAYLTVFYYLMFCSNNLLKAATIKSGKFRVQSHVYLHFYSLPSSYVGLGKLFHIFWHLFFHLYNGKKFRASTLFCTEQIYNCQMTFYFSQNSCN